MQEVTKDRDKYIGGSDIPVIMGLSPFKNRWQLLQEKAHITEPDFAGNKYTEYGNEMEGQIRNYINKSRKQNFVEHKVIDSDLRYHADGYDENDNIVLEIKTTSQIHDEIAGYKRYIVQLIYGMWMYKTDKGLLAVYKRPDDFMPLFDSDLLTVYEIDLNDYRLLLDDVMRQVNLFREDLKKLRENPLLTEEDFQPHELIDLVDRYVTLEETLITYKAVSEEFEALKKRIKNVMQENSIKTWTMNNGTKVTLVPDGEDTTVKKFDEKRFKDDNPNEYEKYCIDTVRKGRAGYVKITASKSL